MGYQVGNRPGEVIETGSVTVDVLQTLRGSSAKRLVLPFSRLRQGTALVFSGYSAIWPDPASLKVGAELCIIVVPHAYERAALVIPGVSSAASLVIVVTPNTPNQLRFIERICALADLKERRNNPKLLEELQKSLADEDGRVRDYAGSVLLDTFLDDAPNRVIEMLRAVALAPTTDGAAARDAAGLLNTHVRDEAEPLKVRAALFRTELLVVIGRDDRKLRAAIIELLAFEIATESYETPNAQVLFASKRPPLPFKPTEVLADDERKRLAAVVGEFAKDPDIAELSRILRSWLEAK